MTTSAAYKEAINAPTRKIVPKAIIDLTDPDLVVTSITGDFEGTYSFPDQLTDRDAGYSGGVFATLELNRWLLDGSQNIFPSTPSDRTGEQGIIGNTLSDDDGDNGTTLTINMQGVDTLQLVTVNATGVDVDGYPTQLTLKIYSQNTLLQTITAEPTEAMFHFSGFSTIQPTKLVLTVNKWSLPYRRYRISEFLPGFVEVWGDETIFSMSVIQKADFSNLTLPYSVAAISIDNTSKRFDPHNKAGIFSSITARQAVPMYYGVVIGDSVEYVPVGVYYQQNEGWQIQNDGLTINWNLADMISLLVDRKYEEKSEPVWQEAITGFYPEAFILPIDRTLTQWIDVIVDQLGSQFAGHYTIDQSLGNPTMSCTWDDLQNITCSDLLRFVCQATNSFPTTDPETGYLYIKPINNVSQNLVSLRAQNTIPGSQSNTDIAFLNFALRPIYEDIYYDDEWITHVPIYPEKYVTTQYSVPGTEEISDKTVNIQNPFIFDRTGAMAAASVILTQYGGDVLNVESRGNPARELADIESVEIRPNEIVAARLLEQTLSIADGVMTNQPSKMLQANGGRLYTDVMIITESGTYQIPSGITEIMLVLIGGGDGGYGGDGGTSYYIWGNKDDGAGGQGGLGGKIYSTPLTVNDGQNFVVAIGAGGQGGQGGAWSYNPYLGNRGAAGESGHPTTATFSTVFTSEDGVHMNLGYADLLTSKVFAIAGQDGRTGQSRPVTGLDAINTTGNGGNGGDGGARSVIEYVTRKDFIDNLPQTLTPQQKQQIAQQNGYPAVWGDDYGRGQIIENPKAGANGGNGGSGACLVFWTRSDE